MVNDETPTYDSRRTKAGKYPAQEGKGHTVALEPKAVQQVAGDEAYGATMQRHAEGAVEVPTVPVLEDLFGADLLEPSP